MDTKLLTLLQQATSYAYSRFKLKSENKIYPNKEDLQVYKQSKGKPNSTKEVQDDLPNPSPLQPYFHSHGMDGWRNNNLEYLRNETNYIEKDAMANFNNLNDFLNDFKYPASGNCSELSTLAYGFLVKKLTERKDNETNIALVAYDAPYDHVFIIITKQNKKWPLKFIGINHNSEYICDPWAKINCKIDDYAILWSQKMHKWEARGLKIKLNNDQLSPTNPKILCAPNNGTVQVLDQRNK